MSAGTMMYGMSDGTSVSFADRGKREVGGWTKNVQSYVTKNVTKTGASQVSEAFSARSPPGEWAENGERHNFFCDVNGILNAKSLVAVGLRNVTSLKTAKKAIL